MHHLLLTSILIATVVLLITRLVRFEVTALLIVVALVASGILSPAEALSGLSSPATVTVAAMFVLSAGLMQAGVIDYMSMLLGRWTRGRLSRLLAVTGVVAMLFSAFLNNTPIVIMMVPVLLGLSREYQLAPSKLLIPLSYFAILGGTCTLIGTSTNILVDAVYRDYGGPGFGMFDFARLGVLYVVVGGVYVVLMADRLLPERDALSQMLRPRDRTTFVTEITVAPSSKLAGRRFREVFDIENVRILQLIRGEEVIFSPDLQGPIVPGDTVIVEATRNHIQELLSRGGIEYASVVEDDERVSIRSLNLMMAEVVITPNSAFIDQRLGDIGLNRQYGIKVLAMRRLGRHHQRLLRDMRLRTGDVLLVQGEPRALDTLTESQDALLVEGVEKTQGLGVNAVLSVAIMAAVVILAAFGVLPIAILSLCGVAVMLLTRCLTTAQATRALDTSVLLLLAGTIPLGLAMAKTGLASTIAHPLFTSVGPWGPMALIASLYIITNVLTEFMSNNATAVLLAPIAMQLAMEAEVNPEPLLVAIAFAGSASFSTPIGYQTNTIVMGPGGYRFFDYLRFGFPLNLILWAVATVFIPILWPLY